jgi:hypothetical protein
MLLLSRLIQGVVLAATSAERRYASIVAYLVSITTVVGASSGRALRYRIDQ